jgi:predicted AAA+ superfamily ATPase
LKRIAEKTLLEWRNKKNFKPLLLMGARQVGKTWLMKHLGKEHFSNYIYINFEKDKTYKNLFETNLDVERIINTIALTTGEAIVDGETLLIFDEIQDAPRALSCLKYFAEDRPKLQVIAAGSLLGVALDRGSFPVGKVEFCTIRPMSFEEFLLAINESALVELLNKKEFTIISVLKDRFIKSLRLYYLVGGMPEAVAAFVENNSNLDEVKKIQEAILNAYLQDFAKHAPGTLIPKIITLWDGLVSQLAKENKKFVFGLLKSGARAREYEQAIDWLINYGLIYKIYAVNKVAFPLQAYRDFKSFKLYLSDVGLLSQMAKINPDIIIDDEKFFQEFKGALTEQFVLQEMIASGVNNISYWTNDAGTSEIDFIFEKNSRFYPIEVKATENLQSKSLRVFKDKYPQIHCYRSSLSNYREEEWMTNAPLYALKQILLE